MKAVKTQISLFFFSFIKRLAAYSTSTLSPAVPSPGRVLQIISLLLFKHRQLGILIIGSYKKLFYHKAWRGLMKIKLFVMCAIMRVTSLYGKYSRWWMRFRRFAEGRLWSHGACPEPTEQKYHHLSHLLVNWDVCRVLSCCTWSLVLFSFWTNFRFKHEVKY